MQDSQTQPVQNPPEQLIYIGSYDDYNYRLWRHADQHMVHLNEMLIGSVLYGDRLLVNDAFIPQHEHLREAASDYRVSPFRALVECGWIRILTRTKGRLDTVIERLSQQGMPGKTMSPELKQQLMTWSETLSLQPGIFVPFPRKDLTDGFINLCKFILNKRIQRLSVEGLVFDGDADDTTRFMESITSHLVRNPAAPARTAWETMADDWRGLGKLSVKHHDCIIRLGSLLHQINTCSAVAASREELAIRVDTANSSINMLLGIYEDPKPTHPEIDRGDSRITVYKGLPFEADNWERLIQMAKNDIQYAGEVLLARRRYRAAVDAHASATTDIQHAREDMEDAALNYGKKLNAHFLDPIIDKRSRELGKNIVKSVAKFGLATITGDASVGVAAGTYAMSKLPLKTQDQISDAPTKVYRWLESKGEDLGVVSSPGPYTIDRVKGSELPIDGVKARDFMRSVKNYSG